jgi:hypothetical protein
MTDKIAVFISHIGEEAALAHSLKSWIEPTFPGPTRPSNRLFLERRIADSICQKPAGSVQGALALRVRGV